MTKAKKFIAAAAAALALASSPAFALTAPEALQTMQAHGFYGVKDFDREHGYWTAKALSKEGVRHYLLLNDATGEFLAFTRADIGASSQSLLSPGSCSPSYGRDPCRVFCRG